MLSHAPRDVDTRILGTSTLSHAPSALDTSINPIGCNLAQCFPFPYVFSVDGSHAVSPFDMVRALADVDIHWPDLASSFAAAP